MWFKDITKVNTLALEMSCGFKVIKEDDEHIEFRISSPRDIDRVLISKKEELFEILAFRRNKLCGYKGKIVKESLIQELETITETIFS